jgi:hypothetical protein
MGTKDYLAKAFEIVTIILAGFSGYLKGIAPPDETGASFWVGVVSFATLLIFLVVLTLARGKLRSEQKKYWLGAALILFVLFIRFAFAYQTDRELLTFLWPPNEDPKSLYVGGGTSLTSKAQAAKDRDPSLTSAQLVAGFGGIDKDLGVDRRSAVWPPEAIQSARKKLSVDYLVLVLSIATAIFCLTEGILPRDQT